MNTEPELLRKLLIYTSKQVDIIYSDSDYLVSYPLGKRWNISSRGVMNSTTTTRYR